MELNPSTRLSPSTFNFLRTFRRTGFRKLYYVRRYIIIFSFLNVFPSHITMTLKDLLPSSLKFLLIPPQYCFFSTNIHSLSSISKCISVLGKKAVSWEGMVTGGERGENWPGKYSILFGNWRQHTKVQFFCAVTCSLASYHIY